MLNLEKKSKTKQKKIPSCLPLNHMLFFLTALLKCALIWTMNSVDCARETGPPASTQEDPGCNESDRRPLFVECISLIHL